MDQMIQEQKRTLGNRVDGFVESLFKTKTALLFVALLILWGVAVWNSFTTGREVRQHFNEGAFYKEMSLRQDALLVEIIGSLPSSSQARNLIEKRRNDILIQSSRALKGVVFDTVRVIVSDSAKKDIVKPILNDSTKP